MSLKSQSAAGLCAADGGTPGQFAPPALLRSRHLQSLAPHWPWRRQSIRWQARALVESAESSILDCGDGVRLMGFPSAPRGSSRGLVVLLHGWEGSASSSYILSAGVALLGAGFSIFRLNFRDHGETQALNEGLFHSCRLDEVLNAVIRIREQHGQGCFGIVGQSLGGNFGLRIAARARASGLELDRVIAICPVLEPQSTMRALDDGPWIYRRYFLSRWRRSLAIKAALFPDVYDFGDLGRFRTLAAMTEFFVERYTEFPSLDAYLSAYAITGDVLAPLDVPSRIILAADDPVIPVEDVKSVASPDALELHVLEHGGHCGFVDRLAGPSWVDREIVADFERATREPRAV
jgi:hypothetical protein